MTRGRWNRIAFLTWKDFWYLIREPETLFWMFLMPFVFFFFIGSIAGGGGGGSGVENLAVWAPDEGVLVPAIEERLTDLGYTVTRIDTLEHMERYNRQLRYPAAFSDSVLAGNQATVTFRRTDESILGGQYDDIRIQRAIYETLADIVLIDRDDLGFTIESFETRRQQPVLIGLEVEQAGTHHEPPDGFQQAVPGTMVTFVLIILLTGGAYLLITERQGGHLRRLAAAPVDKIDVFAAKGLSRLGMGLVQIGVGLSAGAFVFKVDWGPHIGALLVILVLWGAVAAAMGVIAASLAKTVNQAIGIGMLLANGMAALSGCWWPIEVTPAWMQKVAWLFPSGWVMDAIHRLTSFGDPVSAIIPHVLLLLSATIILAFIGRKVFRFD
ncbi:ABC transporter permease [Gemmatimonadota bacterium]